MSDTLKIVLISTAGFVVLAVFGLIFFINNLSYSFIQQQFIKATGLKIEFVKPKSVLDYKFAATCRAQEINIYDKTKKIKFISLIEPEISIKPLSLLFHKLNVKNFSAKKVEINLKRDEFGEVDILKSIKKNLPPVNNLQISRLYSFVDDFQFNFEDDFGAKSKVSFEIKNSNIKISKRKKIFSINHSGNIKTVFNNVLKSADFKADIKSKYPFSDINSSDLNFDVELNNLNLFIFSDLAKKYISKDIKTLEGTASFSLKTNEEQELVLKIKNPKMNLADKTVAPYEEINVLSNFRADKNKIAIDDFKILSNNLDFEIYGEIEKPFSKKPHYEINTTIQNTQINNFLYLLPDDLIFYRPQGIPTLKKSNFHALLNGSAKLKLFPLDIEGTIKASDIHIPNYPKPYMQNDASLIFQKDKLRVYTKVYTPDNEYVVVDGISNLDESLWGKYSVQSTKKIDLSFARLYLVPIQQIIGFNIGPVPIMDITGYGNIDIKTQGTIKDAQIFGEFSAYNASAKIEGLDAKLQNGSCKLIFDNKNLIFKEIKGNLDGADFLLTGNGNTKGEVELFVKLKNALLSKVLKIFDNSVISKPYMPLVQNIAATSGQMSADISLKGTISDYESEELFKVLSPSGVLEFKNNRIILNNGFGIKNLSGFLNFGSKQSGMFEFMVNNSKLACEFQSNDSVEKIASGAQFDASFSLLSNKLEFQDVIAEFKNFDFKDINFLSKFNLKTNLKLSTNNLKNVKFSGAKGFLVGLNSAKNTLKFNSGLIRFENNKLIFDNFDADFEEGNVKIRGNIADFLSGKPVFDFSAALSDIKLEKFENIFKKIKFANATLKSGEILAHGNNLKLNAININYNQTPVLLNVKINDIYNNSNFDVDFSTIANELTADSLINPYLTYPIKIKGEIPAKGRFFGTSQNYTVDFSASIPQNSDLSFGGANIGDVDIKREVSGKINIAQNVANLNNLRLVKLIENQSGKSNPIVALSLSGKAIAQNDGVYYDNFKIITSAPINVRILNLIFKKSLLKKGNFECTLNLNGNVQNPAATGKIDLQDLDIPLYSTQINNIKINLQKDIMEGEFTAKNKQSDFRAAFRAKNTFLPPFVIDKLVLNSNKINIQEIIDSIPKSRAKSDISSNRDFELKSQDVTVKEGSFNFREVVFDKINLQNMRGNFSYNNSTFDLKNIILLIAQGEVEANGKYDINSTKLALTASMRECDANILAKEFLNMQGQIFGKINGVVNLTAKNLNTPEGIKNVKSDVNFTVNNGKMPKLGSLEYLLRAGNLIKNGILGLSVNNLIHVLTPYKTGEFDKITGTFTINQAKVENLEIISKGKNMSLYLAGEYGILDNFANIKIYGKLSQNVSSAISKMGNASLRQFINTLTKTAKTQRANELQEALDKIPSTESESDDPVYFSAKVFGDINKDNYIKQFEWLP